LYAPDETKPPITSTVSQPYPYQNGFIVYRVADCLARVHKYVMYLHGRIKAVAVINGHDGGRGLPR
jgi:hypothetical protein